MGGKVKWDKACHVLSILSSIVRTQTLASKTLASCSKVARLVVVMLVAGLVIRLRS